jgi:hypothetical protein
MNTAEAIDSTAIPTDVDLSQLQLRIARRADTLAQRRTGSRDPKTDWECWLAAEQEELAAEGSPLALKAR